YWTRPYNLVDYYDRCDEGPLRLAHPSRDGRTCPGGLWVSGRNGLPPRAELPTWLVFAGGPPVGGCPDLLCRAAASLPLGLDGPGRVALVRAGVVAEVVEVCPGGLGAWAALDASALQADASGLGLVRDQVYDELVNQAFDLWNNAARLLEETDRPPPIHPPFKPQSPPGRIARPGLNEVMAMRGEKARQELLVAIRQRLAGADWYRISYF
ncbi:MAG: hypothetical protein KC910_23985, partial [Candidatus Eremiobacteraeota bacterium]|nr:hypothetical protein [Candidatus Eremiobacteraeota bacterium]